VARIVVPTTNTVITSAWGKTVADGINEVLVQRGTANPTTDATGLFTVSYPIPYTAAPTVVASIAGGSGTVAFFICVIVPHALAAFQAQVRSIGGGPYVGPIFVNWIAVGPRP